ncbi:MAG TPA: PHP domain-containing protein [Steroidobacteraceae bacterium]|nr:PHP domain-containing protein [Steroidobacteraceae bacterium]
MEMLIDLHTHSHHSDGTLAPAELVARAVARGVQVLALTDHDTTAGAAEAHQACSAAGIHCVAGVEVTASWRGQEIHIVGLGVDPSATPLQSHLTHLVQLRRARIAAIGEKLRRSRKFTGVDPAQQLLEAGGVPTRTHLARAIVQGGLAKSVQDAFDRFLGRGTPGHVPQQWPEMPVAVDVIRQAGGHAVLAHPHRYKLSAGALRNLCAEFRDCGGAALEVSLPALSPNDASRLASLARQHALAGSAGSDFHEPGLPWRPLGRFAKLPEGIEPLLPRLRIMNHE